MQSFSIIGPVVMVILLDAAMKLTLVLFYVLGLNIGQIRKYQKIVTCVLGECFKLCTYHV